MNPKKAKFKLLQIQNFVHFSIKNVQVEEINY